MSKNDLSPPKPEVIYLPAIFRKIDNGKIRVPAFQREFVWSEDQITKLLESVYRGFPIGSILMWNVSEEKLRVDYDKTIPFPDRREQYPLSFVLDGMQRLASLYGVFHDRDDIPKKFNIRFNLQEEIFIHEEDVRDENYCIDPSVLFNPKRLLETQKNLSSLSEGDAFIDKTVNLQSSFQEYLLPTITISNRKVDEVVSIFERINSTGTLLSTVDFMRALTWSEEFDLNKEIDSLKNEYERKGFLIADDTFTKLIAVSLDFKPESGAMLQMKDVAPDQLHDAVSKVRRALDHTIEFLNEHLNIYSYDYVPYEGQTVALTKLFLSNAEPVDEVLETIEKWFWSVSLGERLRGKPDHYLSRMLRDIEELAQGDTGAVDHRLDLPLADIQERKFISRAALSSGMATLLARRSSLSLLSGEEIPHTYYMGEFTKENYAPLFGTDEVNEALDIDSSTPRVISNMVVVKEDESDFVEDTDPDQILEQMIAEMGRERTIEVMESQLIPTEAVECIALNNVEKFFEVRAERIHEACVEVTK